MKSGNIPKGSVQRSTGLKSRIPDNNCFRCAFKSNGGGIQKSFHHRLQFNQAEVSKFFLQNFALK